jgi:hypothetical protein
LSEEEGLRRNPTAAEVGAAERRVEIRPPRRAPARPSAAVVDLAIVVALTWLEALE